MNAMDDLNKEIKDQILKHKWLESEKLGMDIGWTKAEKEWLDNHFSGWAIWCKSELIKAIEEQT